MSNINLDFSETNMPRSDSGNSRNPLIVPSIIILMTALLYGGIIFGKKVLDGKIEATKAQREAELKIILGGRSSDVLDFGVRSNVARGLNEKKQPIENILAGIESSILPSVYIETFDFNEKTGVSKIDCVCDGFNSFAKQILSLKQSDYFKSIVPLESSIDIETGQVKFSLEIVNK